MRLKACAATSGAGRTIGFSSPGWFIGRMGDVVNLRKWRRAKAKEDETFQASANRAAFGRTKAQKLQDEAEEARRRALLDAARLEPGSKD